MKYRVLLITILLLTIAVGTGITYSMFTSDSDLVANQEIAKFIFDAKKTDHIDLPLTELVPGSTETYTFQVSNSASSKKSHVTLNYRISLETYHFIPLKLELYKIVDGTETLVMDCNETYSRNDQNALVCNSDIQEMNYSKEVLDEYKIKAIFPKEYSSEDYADLVDYISVDIKSWQKTSE